MKNYYRILGLKENASTEEIKRAYRKLAKEFHPDKNASPSAEGHFQEILEAYTTLSDSSKRQIYDNPAKDYASYQTDQPENVPQATPKTIFWGIYVLILGVGLMILQNLWNPTWWNPRIGLLVVILGLALIGFGIFLREKRYFFGKKTTV